VALWLMCCVFIIVVVIVMIVLDGKIDTIGAEQARRTGVMTELKAFREEIATLRGKLEDRAVLLESMKGQQLTNVLNVSLLEKKVDTLNARLNDLVYAQRPLVRPSSPLSKK
jgi:hypothetical protein